MFMFAGTVVHRARALELHQATFSWPATLENPPAAQHAQELPPHVLTAQRVDQRVQCRVQGGNSEEDVGVAENGAGGHPA